MLAGRGAGDALIRNDLERQGVAGELIAAALAELEPEPVRVARIVKADGNTPRTLRRLAAKGFGDEALEAFVADVYEPELG